LMSDSCLRFGRGVDPKGAARGALRFAYLVDKLECGRFVSGSYRDVDLRRDETEAITFPLVKVSGLLGIDIPDERSMELLESAGFSLSGKPPVIKVLAPSWRGDFEIPEDFVEEVLRLYSFTRVEPAMPDVPMGQGSADGAGQVRGYVRVGIEDPRHYAEYGAPGSAYIHAS